MISIDDEDVEHVARLLELTLDAESVAFLKQLNTCEVHACPGSGKTTLLVAKLAILVRKWPWRDRGVLVLSHTNVARREVESRLAHDATGSRLLRYPHFIGTIQGFVDRFLAFPYLRDVGVNGKRIEEPRVDDKLFGERAWARFVALQWRDYKQARSFLKKRHEEGKGTISTLSYRGSELALDQDVVGPDTPSGKQLRALKDRLAADGCFRFEDMFAFARASIERHPFLRDALVRRFPWVFIDEVQDTAKDHEALLDDLFATPNANVGAGFRARRPSLTGSILQRLGDRNQGIFRGDDQTNDFSGHDALDLPRSHRLAPKIAQFASPLTSVRAQTLLGNTNRRDRAHSLFLFGDGEAAGVLPAYGDLILREWDHVPPTFTAKAVGFRRNVVVPARMPGRIGDYWAGYAGDLQREPSQGVTFIESVQRARRLVQHQKSFYAAHRMVLESVAMLIERHEGTRTTRHQLMERFREGTHDERGIRSLVTQLLRDPVLTLETWSFVTLTLGDLLFGGSPATEALGFLAWGVGAGSPGTESSPSNVYRHSAGGRSVDIVVSTIHSVKGETHDATLVLETFDHDYDVPSVLPYLCGEAPKKKLKKRELDHMKRVFVAMTRPRELVCLALHEKHVTEAQLVSLKAAGWEVRACGTTAVD